MGVRSKKSLIEQAQDVVLDVAEQIQPHIEAAVDKSKEVAGGAAASLSATLDDTRDGAEKKVAAAEKSAQKQTRAVRKEASKQSKDVKKAVAKEAKAASKDAKKAGKDARKSVEKSARRQAAAVGATATAVAAAVKNHGEEPKKKGSGFKKLLVLGALAGVAGFLYKKFAGGGAPAPSTAPYTPPTSPAPRATPAAAPAAVAEAGDDHPSIPESLDDIPGAQANESSDDDVQPWPHDHLDSQSDPMIASDEPAPYKPGKTGEALN